MRMKLTKDIAYSAGWDAGNSAMRAGGRTSWSEDDYNAAAAETNRLLDIIDQWENPTLPSEGR